MQAKLFHYKIDYKKPAEYELSSVELNQDLLINVDFDMGMPLDLINREIYQPDVPIPRRETNEREKQELREQLEKLKLAHFDERDRFTLSDATLY